MVYIYINIYIYIYIYIYGSNAGFEEDNNVLVSLKSCLLSESRSFITRV